MLQMAMEYLADLGKQIADFYRENTDFVNGVAETLSSVPPRGPLRNTV